MWAAAMRAVRAGGWGPNSPGKTAGIKIQIKAKAKNILEKVQVPGQLALQEHLTVGRSE